MLTKYSQSDTLDDGISAYTQQSFVGLDLNKRCSGSLVSNLHRFVPGVSRTPAESIDGVLTAVVRAGV